MLLFESMKLIVIFLTCFLALNVEVGFAAGGLCENIWVTGGQISLRTSRLKMRPLATSESSTLHDLWTDSRVNTLLGAEKATPALTEEMIRESVLNFTARDLRSRMELGIFLEDQFIGQVSVVRNVNERQFLTFLIGYSVIPEMQRLGFAREAVRAVVAAMFASTNVRTVDAFVLDSNQPSITVLTAIGFAPFDSDDKGKTLFRIDRAGLARSAKKITR